MTTIAIDTHKTINKLVEKGYTKEQAEGLVDALTESNLVTKDDLNSMVKDLKIWVLMMLLAQAALIVTLQSLINGS